MNAPEASRRGGDVFEIATEDDRARVLARIDGATLPCLVQIQEGARRTSAQNAAYRALVGAIAAATGHEPAMLHRHFGRRFLAFEEDTVGDLSAVVPVSTRALTKAGMSALIEQVQALAAWLGIDTAATKAVQRIGHVDRSGVMHELEIPPEEALCGALREIEKGFGSSAVMRADTCDVTSVIPTGSLGLDLALGIGGVPRGRIVEIYGPEASGKTTLALQIIAEAQRRGGTAAFIDAEQTLDTVYAGRLGVRLDRLLVSRVDTGEHALDIAESLVRSGGVDVVVVDSVAALTPQAERDVGIGQAPAGLQARLMSEGLRKLVGPARRSGCTVIFVNQLRVTGGGGRGFTETTAGGYALRFYASVRMDIRTVGGIQQGGAVVGTTVEVGVVKNKLAPPFRSARFDILFGDGISRADELLALGLAWGVVEQVGGVYRYERVSLGRTIDRAREALRRNAVLMADLGMRVRAAAGKRTHDAPYQEAVA